MNPDRLPIFLRAHTEKVRERSQSKPKKDKSLPSPWPEWALIFDTETRTTVDQTIMFIVYRICKLVNGMYRTEREGLACEAGIQKKELDAIRAFVTTTPPEAEVRKFPPQITFDVHSSFDEFLEQMFFPFLRKGHLIAGFNLPFDLSRLIVDWRKTRARGFALILSKCWWRKTGRWVSNPYRPPINIEAKDAKTAFMSIGRTKCPAEWENDARLLDIGTLLFAVFDQHQSLRSWCEYFREQRKLNWVHQKIDHEPSGRVTLDELTYCRGDVQCTQDLLNCAKAEFDLYELQDLLPDKAYSSASIGKAIFRQMRITRPSLKFEVRPELQGIFMQSYYGGRAECHTRKVKVPVMRLDFLSQYPTANTLMRNWEIVTAARLSFPEVTKEVRELVRNATLANCFQKSFWPKLRFFALVEPDNDIFPVRAPFDPRDREHLNIANDRLTSTQPIWMAGPELIASVIRTRKAPKILKAIAVVPHGKQRGMRPIVLRGAIEIDPYRDDFFKVLIELRQANESDKTLKHALKVIANATAYGSFVELNEQKEPRRKSRKIEGQSDRVRVSNAVRLNVYSGEHQHEQPLWDLEVPGKLYFPALASLITAGGRLLLAMAEQCVIEAGGEWLFCDTDSIAVIASPKGGTVYPRRPAEESSMSDREISPIPVLTHAKVLKIARQFRSLNPYSFGGDLLKIEDVNYKNGDPKTKELRTVHGYAISAKRYALLDGSRIVEAKGHGLGYLMSPVGRGEPDWIETAWDYLLHFDGVLSGKLPEPPWLDRPAMMKIPVSSPAVLGRLKGFVKPYDFVLAPILQTDDLDPEERAEKPILITRFTTHSEEWLKAVYYNVRTAEECRITTGKTKKGRIRVKTYREILQQYLYHPECKFAGPDGKPCDPWTRGVLERRHIVADRHSHCGKEFKRKLEQGPVDHELDVRCKVYENGKVAADPETLRLLKQFSEREIARATALHRSRFRLLREGGTVTQRTLQKIVTFLNIT